MTTTPECATITLQEPIQRANGEPIAEITLRKPKAGELRGLKVEDLYGSDINSLLVLIPRIASPVLVKEHVEQIGTEDLMEIAGAVRGFFMTAGMKAAVAKAFGAMDEEPGSSS